MSKTTVLNPECQCGRVSIECGIGNGATPEVKIDTLDEWGI